MNIYNLSDEELKDIIKGNCPGVAIEFSAHTKLSLNIFLQGDLLHLENEENVGTIEIKQTFYARLIGENLKLSLNLVDWKPFLEFITGTASVALTMQHGQPLMIMGIEANYRS